MRNSLRDSGLSRRSRIGSRKPGIHEEPTTIGSHHGRWVYD